MTFPRGAWAGWAAAAVAAAMTAAAPVGAAAQSLADFDYEHLSFRGFAPEWGHIWPDRVKPTRSFGVRLDLGYLGPGVRVVPSVTYWRSTFKAAEVRKLEDRVADLIVSQIDDPAPVVELGVIDWSNVALTVDAHVVWRIPFGILTYTGLGASGHILNGAGTAIEGTFVEDLLDSVTAGVNVHAGVEYPLVRRVRLYGQGRYELLGDLRYAQLRLGAQFMLGAAAPGEVSR